MEIDWIPVADHITVIMTFFGADLSFRACWPFEPSMLPYELAGVVEVDPCFITGDDAAPAPLAIGKGLKKACSFRDTDLFLSRRKGVGYPSIVDADQVKTFNKNPMYCPWMNRQCSCEFL